MISPVSPPIQGLLPPSFLQIWFLISSFILSSVFLPFNYLQRHVSCGNACPELLSLVVALTLTSKLLGRVTLTSAIYSLLLLAYQMTEVCFHLYHHSNHQWQGHQWAPHCRIQWLQVCDIWDCFPHLLETISLASWIPSSLCSLPFLLKTSSLVSITRFPSIPTYINTGTINNR